MELAKHIAAGPPIALRYMKDNLSRALHQALTQSLVFASRDDAEMKAAHAEKRKPRDRNR